MPYRDASPPADLVITTFNGRIRVIEVQTGRLRWEHAPATVTANPEFAADHQRLFVFLEAELTAFDLASGERLWMVTLPFDRSARATRLEVHGGVVLVSLQNQLRACSVENGAELWRAPASRWTTVR